MEALRIISASWPFAVMFVGFCTAIILIVLIRSWRASDREDREFRANTARDVTPYKARHDD